MLMLLAMFLQTFYGKESHTLLQACSRAARTKVILSSIPNRLNYCVRFIVYTKFTYVVAVRRLETQALGVWWAIRKMHDARLAGMAHQYYTFYRTGLNLDMARGYTEKYQDNYIILVVADYWSLHMEGREQIWALQMPDNEVTRLIS
jgi:hypothetical protein